MSPGPTRVLLILGAVLLTDPAAGGSPPIFSEEAASTGLDFVHFNGMSGEKYILETMAPGAALLDYDNDGDLDVYLVQGHLLGPGKTLGPGETLDGAPRDRLYRNDLVAHPDGSRTLRFTDVTEESGIDSPGYGMGAATGDYDNDGRVDLYVTHYGVNRLWRNNGAGADGKVTFSDVTAASGAGDPLWSVSAAFLDYDRDGWLDLYVGNYVDFSYKAHAACTAEQGDCLGPLAYAPQPDRLLKNRGRGADGRVSFEDVSTRALQKPPHGTRGKTAFGGALGVVTADFNGDGWIDIYVANDETPNLLWLNRQGESFLDEALLAGCSANAEGQPESSMGVDAGDFDGDGDPDLVMTHLLRQTNTLYVNDGRGLFRDATVGSGLGAPSLGHTSFGAAWLDYDNDGRLDLLVVNGAVRPRDELLLRRDPFPLHETNQLFRNLGPDAGGRFAFEDVTARAGEAFELSEVSRGAAFGDLDNDGDTDVVVSNNNQPVRLLINRVGQSRPWLGLRLVGAAGRDMLGARVAVYRQDGSVLWRRVRTDGSYASANDPRVLVGLGESAVDRVRVFWPEGRTEDFFEVPTGVYVTLREGSGETR